jgi:hypothetical protein
VGLRNRRNFFLFIAYCLMSTAYAVALTWPVVRMCDERLWKRSGAGLILVSPGQH